MVDVKKKVLAFGEPYVRCYNHHAFCTGIIRSAPIDQDWIYNDYIQVLYKQKKDHSIDFKAAYFFNDRDIFIKVDLFIPMVYMGKKEIIDLLKANIDVNAYITGNFDEYYIPGMKAYQNYHFKHNYMLYGYDDSKEVFYTAGYNKQQQWTHYQLSYQDYLNSLIKDPEIIRPTNYIVNTYYDEELDAKTIRKGILAYLGTGDKGPEGLVYGEEGVREYFRFVVEQISRGDEVHIPSIYVLFEQKKLMLERMRLLVRKNKANISQGLIEAYQGIYYKYMNLVNVYLKYLFSMKCGLAEHVKKLSEDAILKERSLLNELCEELGA